jgi:hypothetical protein
MSPNVRAHPAAIERQRMALILHRFGRWAAILIATALVVGCTGNPRSPFRGPDPSQPAARVPSVSYRSTVAPYVRQRPVAPAPWLRQNEQVAPKPQQ